METDFLRTSFVGLLAFIMFYEFRTEPQLRDMSDVRVKIKFYWYLISRYELSLKS
jgi:hypothetical protein